MTLADLRISLGMSQGELAERAGMTQAELSRVERRADHLVSTLRRIAAGLGIELRVTAVVGDDEVELLEL